MIAHSDSFAIWFVDGWCWIMPCKLSIYFVFFSRRITVECGLCVCVCLTEFRSNLISGFHHVIRICNGPVFHTMENYERYFGWWVQKHQRHHQGNAKLFHIILSQHIFTSFFHICVLMHTRTENITSSFPFVNAVHESKTNSVSPNEIYISSPGEAQCSNLIFNSLKAISVHSVLGDDDSS